MKYGEMTRGLRHLFKDQGDGEDEMEWDALRHLLKEEAEGMLVVRNGAAEAEIFLRVTLPAVVFLVLRTPAAEGLRALDEVRDALSFHLPVVVIAPPASSEFKMQMLERGIYAYLEEPIQAGQIEELVKEIRRM